MNKENNQVEYFKKTIEEFSKYRDDDLYIYFKTALIGNIVMSYPTEFINEIYSHFSHLLQKRYTTLCNEKDIFNTLSQYGSIYTAKLLPKYGEAIYHLNSANILLYSYLNKLNKTIVHELIHKLGYLKFNEDFYEMPNIFKEAGTELITNTILEQPECKEVILGNIWTKSVGVQPAYLLEISLINQLNFLCKNNLLEKSIIQGHNYIEPEIKELLGEEYYVILFERLKDICRLEKQYWNSNKRNTKETEKQIFEFQDDLLQIVFDKKLKNIKNIADGQLFLEELMEFSDYRLKVYDKTNQENRFQDKYFQIYFLSKKKELEERFEKKFEIQDKLKTWSTRFPTILLDSKEIEERQETKSKIDQMSKEKQRNKGISGLITRIFFPKKKQEKKLEFPKNDSKCERTFPKRIFLENNNTDSKINNYKNEIDIEEK